MKIAIATETYYPDVNGAAVSTQRLVEGLAKRGHTVHVIAPSPVGYSFIQDMSRVRIHRVPSFKYPWHPNFHIADPRLVRPAVRMVLQEIRPDVVHLHGHLVVGRVAARESTQLRIPVIATNHFLPENLRYQSPVPIPDFAFKILAKIVWRDTRSVLNAAAIVTTPTPYAAALLKRRTKIRYAIPVSCGVTIDSFHSSTFDRILHNPPTILFVGRLDSEKHVGEPVQALQYLDPQVRMRIVGAGPCERELRRLVSRLDLESRVFFAGYVNDEELKNEYARSDVFCMPGRAELQSIATLEAMASGLPIVAARSHALPHLVENNVNGMLYQPGNIAALASSLRYTLADSTRWRSFSMSSITKSKAHDLKYSIDRFEQLYLKLSDQTQDLPAF
ncbi:glycosyltransferase [Nocardia sp. CC201C]|uniref:glycosyltransferase n=1 Tax=Nocardia sp. CC201C TaxID=3044575 RepID=UPI0024A9E4EE|nr:glycosyltransferase [Nocardia sp. CC201C]